MYINGVQIVSAALTGAISTNSNTLNIASWSGTAEYLAGTVDEVAVYPSVLTPTQIAQHYTTGTTVTAAFDSSAAAAATTTLAGTSPVATGVDDTLGRIYVTRNTERVGVGQRRDGDRLGNASRRRRDHDRAVGPERRGGRRGAPPRVRHRGDLGFHRRPQCRRGDRRPHEQDRPPDRGRPRPEGDHGELRDQPRLRHGRERDRRRTGRLGHQRRHRQGDRLDPDGPVPRYYENPLGLAVDGRSNTIYTTNPLEGTLYIIDGATNRITRSLALGDEPTAVAADPSTARAFVAQAGRGSTKVSVIDGRRAAVVRSIRLDGSPMGVAVDASGATAYVTTAGHGTAVVDTSSARVYGLLDCGPGTYGVTVGADGSVVVADRVDGIVCVLPRRTVARIT